MTREELLEWARHLTEQIEQLDADAAGLDQVKYALSDLSIAIREARHVAAH